MRTPSKIVLLTVSMVMLAGLLSAGAALWNSLRQSGEYDEALRAELQQKGLAYAKTASAFLGSPNANIGGTISELLPSSFEQSQELVNQPPTTDPSQFENALLGFQAWLPDASVPTGYRLVYEQTLEGAQNSLMDDPVLLALVGKVGGTGAADASLDERERDIDFALPIRLPNGPTYIGVGTLAADDEFAFIAQQHTQAIRDGVVTSVVIGLLVAVAGAGLSLYISRDLTNRTRAEVALRESEERYRTLANVAPVGIFRTDMVGKGIFANERNIEIFGAPLEDTLGFGWVGKLPPEERERVIARWQAWPKDKPVRIEQRFLRPDGSPVWVLVNIAPEANARGETVGLVGVVTDITEQKQMEEALRDQTRRDPLTGVLNHAAIVEELRDVLAREAARPCAVAMVDIDGMKATNDTYGHQVGDDVLQTVARALGRDGTLLGRYGGDEFVAIIDGADRAAATRYRDEVAATLAETIVTDPESGARVPVSVSLGLAIHPEEAQTVTDLLKLSDNAMYASRLRRPVVHNIRGMPRRRDEQAARMVGEMVPLLTSEGTLEEKLRLVAHRLSVGAGYDAVNFELLDPETKGLLLSSTFAQVPPEQAKDWEQHERQQGSHSLVPIVERTRRPLIVNSVADERLSEAEREMLVRGGLRSMLVAPMIWQDHMVGAMTVLSKKEAAFGPRDAQFLTAIATQVTAIVRMNLLLEQLRSATDRLARTHEETVLLLAAAGEAHDQTNGHFRHVRTLSELLARELGGDGDHARELGLAAALHDIGKIHVPEHVLANTGKLSDEEWQLMRQHTIWGGEFFAARPGFELAAAVARCHHEHWDGTGYPDGLVGEAIPQAATIVAVADAFDAIVSSRPYHTGQTIEMAVEEIVTCSGTHFSPRVVDALLRIHGRGELPRQEMNKAA